MTLTRNTVLEVIKLEKNGISIEELPFVGKINLRGSSKDRDFLSNTGSVLNILIPTDPNTKIQNEELQVIWLSPNEWVLNFYNNNNNFIKIFNELNNKLNPEKTSVTDTSENSDLKQGERVGMIRFGSRADLYFENYKPLVKVNQKTIAGESLIAKR